MNHTDLQDHYELYTLGLAEEPERNEIREHLDRGCEVCMLGIKRARQISALLGGSAAQGVPSPKLRKRILASVGVEQRGFGWAPLLAATTALGICAAVYFYGRERDFSQQVSSLTKTSRQQVIDINHLQEAFAILYGPDTVVSSYGEQKPMPKGKVFVNPSMGVLLIASNLPQAPAGKAYEFWFIPKAQGAKPVRGGMFQSEGNGTAMYMERGPVDLASTAAVAVTMEDERGVDAPTSTPMIVAALTQAPH